MSYMDERNAAGDTADGLSARQKGDIYWKKLKYFLQAVKDKNISDDGERKGRYLAQKLIARRNAENMEETGEFIDGNEFKLRPPTSTGEQVHEDNLWKTICNLNYFRDILQKNAGNTADGTDAIVLKRLNSLQKVIAETVETTFRAYGLNYLTGAVVSDADIKKAKEGQPVLIKKYEAAVKQFKSKVALSVADSLRDILSPESVQPDTSAITDLIKEYPDSYFTYKGTVDTALKELETILKKRSRAEAELESLKKYAEEKGSDSAPVSFMDYSEFISVYEECMEEFFISMDWAAEGCEACIRSLLTGTAPDPFMSNYIHSRWKVETETYPGDTFVSSLPGYRQPEYDKENPALYKYETIEDVKQGIAELKKYREEHSRQFRFQLISDILFDTDDIPEIAGRSKAIRNVLYGWAENGYPGTVSESDKEELKEMWVQAETTGRVAEMVLEYHRNSGRRSMKDLIDAYLYDTQDMDYRLQEKNARSCLEKWLSERDSRLMS